MDSVYRKISHRTVVGPGLESSQTALVACCFLKRFSVFHVPALAAYCCLLTGLRRKSSSSSIGECWVACLAHIPSLGSLIVWKGWFWKHIVICSASHTDGKSKCCVYKGKLCSKASVLKAFKMWIWEQLTKGNRRSDPLVPVQSVVSSS